MTRTRRAVAVFAVLMGSLLLATWVVLFLIGAANSGASLVEFVFLLVAEAATGVTLIFGGASTARRRRWGVPCLLVALGMLLYCTIFSIGVFAAQDNLPATAWFVLVSVATVVGAALLIRDIADEKRVSASGAGRQ